MIARPGSFRGLLLESPSIYADDYHLLKDARSVRNWPDRIYIGTGTVNEPVDDVMKLKAFFEKAGLDKKRLRISVQEGGKHSENWWAQRLPKCSRFSLSKRKVNISPIQTTQREPSNQSLQPTASRRTA